MTDLVIKNAKIVYPDRVVEGGIVVEGGRIVELKKNSDLPSATQTIDAEGMHVLPGLIDAHVHFREPGSSSEEDWITGSSAAAAGGVTTVLDMPNTQPPTTTAKLLEEKREIAESKSIVDYGFHFAAAAGSMGELKKVKDIASVKLYMCSTAGSFQAHSDFVFCEELKIRNDYLFFEELKAIAQAGFVASVHAENSTIAGYLKDKLVKGGRNDAAAYADSKPPLCAAEAAGRAILLSRIAEVKLHICHISTLYEVELLERNKNFQSLTCEVSPHHLFLSVDDFKKTGNKLKTSPPLRSREDQIALWKSLNNGVIDIIASDHMPYLPESKQTDVWNAPAGVPALETMLPLMLNEANKGNISLNKIVQLTSENPAKIFDIKNKGKIEPGYDADFVIVDLEKEQQIKNAKLFTKCGWTPYDGWKVKGAVSKTILRGNVIFDEGKIQKTKGAAIHYI
jgi:dihydroorotase